MHNVLFQTIGGFSLEESYLWTEALFVIVKYGWLLNSSPLSGLGPEFPMVHIPLLGVERYTSEK